MIDSLRVYLQFLRLTILASYDILIYCDFFFCQTNYHKIIV